MKPEEYQVMYDVEDTYWWYVGMRSIFHHRKAMLFGDSENLIHFAWITSIMHGQKHLRFVGYGVFNSVGVDVVGLGVYVNEHRCGTYMKNDVCSRDEGERRRDDLVSFTHAESVQR